MVEIAENAKKIIRIPNGKSLSITDDFFNFCWIVVRLVLISSCFILYSSYQSFEKKIFEKEKQNVAHLEDLFETTLSQNKKILSSIAKKIAHEGKSQDLEFIANLLRYALYLNYEKNHSITNIIWVDEQNKIRASGFSGVHIHPIKTIDATKKDFLDFQKHHPWEVLVYPKIPHSLFYPDAHVIYLSLLLNSESEGFLGRLGLGIHVKRLSKWIQQRLDVKDTTFLIVNKLGQIVIASEAQENLIGKSIHLDEKEAIKNLIDVCQESYHYVIFEQMKGKEFYIFLGVKRGVFDSQFLQHIYPKLMQILFFSFCLLLFLYVYKKRFLKPVLILSEAAKDIAQGRTSIHLPKANCVELEQLADRLREIVAYSEREKNDKTLLSEANDKLQKSCDVVDQQNRELTSVKEQLTQYLTLINEAEIAKDTFRKEFSERAEQKLNQIISDANGLLSLHRKSAASPLTRKAIQLLTNIKNNTFSIGAPMLEAIGLSPCNIVDLLKESLKINANKSFKNNIKVALESDQTNIEILGDKLLLQSSFVVIIRKSIETTPGGLITIKCQTVDSPTNGVEVTITDNGFGHDTSKLDKNHIRDILETTGGVLSLDFNWELLKNDQYIEHIVKSHDGTLDIKSVPGSGRTVRIFLPSEPILKETPKNHPSNKKIISLFKKKE